MMREGVGGSISNYGVGGGQGAFEVASNVVSTANSAMRFLSPVMFSDRAYKIAGVTKDSSGIVLGGCIVTLYYTLNDAAVGDVLSDPTTGAYSFSVGPNLACYIVAYKAGSPDVAGTTVNTLIAT